MSESFEIFIIITLPQFTKWRCNELPNKNYCNNHYRLKHPEDEGEELPPDNPAMNSAMLYDLLVGYGYIPPNSDPLDPDLDLHLEGSSNSNRTGASKLSPTLTMTTCYSPVSSSVQSGNGRLSPAPNETSSSSSSPNFFDSSHFPPYSYSLVLAVTIGVGKLTWWKSSGLSPHLFGIKLCHFLPAGRKMKALL